MTVLPINSTPLLSVFSSPYTVYEINIDIDLLGSTVQMGTKTVLRFKGGSFSHGKIKGNTTYIEYEGTQPVFSDVELEADWRGAVNDLWFSYDAGNHEDFNKPILSSLLHFERIDLYRKEYYLDWGRIGIESSQDIELDGDGATWYISSNKGRINTSDEWGHTYEDYVLITFSSPTDPNDPDNLPSDYNNRNYFRVRNLIIEDNHATIPGITNYGEEIDYSFTYHAGDQNNPDDPGRSVPNHVRYDIFGTLAARLTEFENVKYDGGGQFFKVHNAWVDADRLVFRNCDLHTCGFAVEVQNQGDDTNGIITPGRLNEALFENCILHNHISRFVGVLSFVGVNNTNRLRIVHSRICGFTGNLEVCGVREVSVDHTVFVNHALCSETCLDGNNNIVPGIFTCTNCQFYLTYPESPTLSYTFCASGEHVCLANNCFYLTRYMRFREIHRLYLYDNRFVVPNNVENVLITGTDVRIGYYGNNRVSCPRVQNHHVNLRLDTAFVIAQYDPFILAFNNHTEEIAIWNQGFNWSKDLLTMPQLNQFLSSIQQPQVTLDQEGYATGYSTSPLITTTVLNDTVSFTLIGKSSAFGQGESILATCPVWGADLFVKASSDSVFRVYLDSTLITSLPRSSDDVRLDVTITMINGCFDVFVFVDKELRDRYRIDENSEDYVIPLVLYFTPNLVTKIKGFRFAPGGFILDQPESLLTELFDDDPIRIPEMED